MSENFEVGGIDVGYGFLKWVIENAHGMFASQVAPWAESHFEEGEGPGDSIIFELPERAIVGREANTYGLMDTREDRAWYLSPLYQAMIRAALSEMWGGSLAVRICTGLPVSNMRADKAAVQEHIQRTYAFKRRGRSAQEIDVTDVVVLPQGYAGYADLVFGLEGEVVNSELAMSRVGIIDGGSVTTALLSLDKMTEVPQETESRSGIGTWQIVKTLREWMDDNTRGLKISDHALMDVVTSEHPRLTYHGKRLGVADVVYSAKVALARSVAGMVTRKWNGGGHFDTVLMIGGGPLLYGKLLKKMLPAMADNMKYVEDAQGANARGCYKKAVRTWKRHQFP